MNKPENRAEIQDLLSEINDAITESSAYLWQDNMEDTVSCVVTQDEYVTGADDNISKTDDDGGEKTVKVKNFLPLWDRLYKMLRDEDV